MATKELVFKLKFVDENGAIVEKTAESINDINKSIKDLKNEIENTELGSEQWNNLVNDLGEAENALDKTTEAINDAKNAQKGLGDQLTSAPGIVGQVSNSVKGLGKTFKALLANPIVLVIAAIVAGLTALYKAFTSTKAGGEKMEQVMAGLGAAMDVLRDRVLKVGGAIIKFFSGDFSGAAEDLKGAFSGIGDEIASEFNEAMRLKAELQAITDAQRELNNERARQNTEIAKAKLIINDETKSYKERQAALEEVRQAEIALAKQEEILAQRRYDAIKAQNALSDSSKEALDEEAAAYQRLQQAQLASLQKQKELYDQQKALRDRERAERKAAYDKYIQELQAARDFEEQLMLESIQDERDRAEEEIRIQEEKQLQQLKSLRLSEERKAELTLQIQANTQVKLQKLEEEGYAKTLEGVNAFRALLIQQELVYGDSVIKLTETRMEKELDMLNKVVEGEYEGILDREEYLNNFQHTEQELLQKASDAYTRYYDTQRYEAEQAYRADLNNSAAREEERQKQLEDAKEVYKRQLQDRLEIERQNSEDGLMLMEDFVRIRQEVSQQQKEEEARINAYFDNYETQRTAQFQATLTNINTEEQQKRTETLEKFSAVRDKIRQQEMQAEMERINLATSGLDALSELAGRESELGKQLAIASTTISTYQAAQQAYASQLAIPTPDAPVRAAIAAGIAIAQGLARVVAITNTNTDIKAADGMVVGQGSGRMDNIGVKVSNGESIINARSTRMFGGLLSAINQAGGGKRFATGGITGLSTQTSPETNLLNQLVGTNKSPMKTYVVSSDVSSNQSLDRQIKSRSVL